MTQLDLAGMAAAGVATAPRCPSGQTAAQLQQAAFAARTAAGTALTMSATGTVSAAAPRSFPFWSSLAGVSSSRGAQQVRATAQRLLQQQQAVSNDKSYIDNNKNSGAAGAGRQSVGRMSTSRSSLALTAASLGMAQDQLAAILRNNGLGANMGIENLSSAAGGQKAPPGLYSATSGGNMGNSKTQLATSNGCSRDLIAACLAKVAVAKVADIRSNGKGSSHVSMSLHKESRMDIALDMFKIELKCLLKHCMLAAGFELYQTEECDALYLDCAEHAVDEQCQRVARIRSQIELSGGCDV